MNGASSQGQDKAVGCRICGCTDMLARWNILAGKCWASGFGEISGAATSPAIRIQRSNLSAPSACWWWIRNGTWFDGGKDCRGQTWYRLEQIRGALRP